MRRQRPPCEAAPSSGPRVRRNSQNVLPWRSWPGRDAACEQSRARDGAGARAGWAYRCRSASARAGGGLSTCTMLARWGLSASETWTGRRWQFHAVAMGKLEVEDGRGSSGLLELPLGSPPHLHRQPHPATPSPTSLMIGRRQLGINKERPAALLTYRPCTSIIAEQQASTPTQA